MNTKRAFAMIASLILSLFGMAAAQAASWTDADSDYARLGVPDMRQAVAFFENVMGCAPLSGGAGTGSSILLECANDRVLELTHASDNPALHGTPVRFRSSDLASASAALRSHHLHTVDHSPQRGVQAVEFLTPWGQRIELVGRNPSAQPVPTTRGIAAD